MKKLFIVLFSILLTVSIFAQVPQQMTYQAVVRNSASKLVVNHAIGVKISILKTSASGEAVFTEIYNPNPETNANGLLTLSIGSGIATKGDFSTIDWSADKYFIKTELDPTGGTAYSIVGTSQLLSVPYALHSKTADNLKGGIVESDPIYKSSPAFGIKNTDITNWNNKQGPMQAGSGIVFKNNKLGITTISEKKYEIGDFAQGGIVFWLDETGEHGLVCAKSDLKEQSGDRWYAGTYGYTRANGNGPYAGADNTVIIIATQIAIGDDLNTYAAYLCNALELKENGKSYGDWYLPSTNELIIMYQNKDAINSTAKANGGNDIQNDNYWSSNDYTDQEAEYINFASGNFGRMNKKNSLKVRAIRRF